MELIQVRPNSEYPTEYLLSRIRGRHIYFVKDWESLVHSPDPLEGLLSSQYSKFISTHSIDGVWKKLLKEFNWIYLQMNSGLRYIFKPFFIYSEIKTLIICFRYRMTEGTETEIKSFLAPSLLSNKIKKILETKKDMSVILDELEKLLLYQYDKQVDLAESFSRDGLTALERNLTTALLELISKKKLHTALKMFFAHVIDSKNITSVYKHLKWGVEAEPFLVTGGNISKERLRRIFLTGGMSGFDKFFNHYYASRTRESGPLNIENILNRYLTRRLKFLSRESQDIGLLLYYLWSSYIEALNLSILLRGKDLDRNRLKEELIY